MTRKNLAIGLLAGFVMLSFYHHKSQQQQAMEFVTHAAEQFRRCPDLNALKALPNQERPLFMREFPNGEWVAIKMEHNCCSGAGFNAVVFVDSRKQITYNTTKNFCGYEGLSANMPGSATPDLDAFYRKISGVRREPYKP